MVSKCVASLVVIRRWVASKMGVEGDREKNVADEAMERRSADGGGEERNCQTDLETAGNRFSRNTRIEIGIGSPNGNRNPSVGECSRCPG